MWTTESRNCSKISWTVREIVFRVWVISRGMDMMQRILYSGITKSPTMRKMYYHGGRFERHSLKCIIDRSHRYFAMSILDHIQRSKALTEWQAMLKGKVVPLERALGAFDMFVLHENRGDFHEVRNLPSISRDFANRMWHRLQTYSMILKNNSKHNIPNLTVWRFDRKPSL